MKTPLTLFFHFTCERPMEEFDEEIWDAAFQQMEEVKKVAKSNETVKKPNPIVVKLKPLPPKKKADPPVVPTKMDVDTTKRPCPVKPVIKPTPPKKQKVNPYENVQLLIRFTGIQFFTLSNVFKILKPLNVILGCTYRPESLYIRNQDSAHVVFYEWTVPLDGKLIAKGSNPYGFHGFNIESWLQIAKLIKTGQCTVVDLLITDDDWIFKGYKDKEDKEDNVFYDSFPPKKNRVQKNPNKTTDCRFKVIEPDPVDYFVKDDSYCSVTVNRSNLHKVASVFDSRGLEISLVVVSIKGDRLVLSSEEDIYKNITLEQHLTCQDVKYCIVEGDSVKTSESNLFEEKKLKVLIRSKYLIYAMNIGNCVENVTLKIPAIPQPLAISYIIPYMGNLAFYIAPAIADNEDK
jgi:hypothetical protein